jgi:tRNA (cmo5U34)-methyltransferase
MFMMSDDHTLPHWDEDTSSRYIDYARYFVPAREQQMKIIVDLLQGIANHGHVLELCCGEGLLAEQILKAYPGAHYRGLDGSPHMLEQAGERLTPYVSRMKLEAFELADQGWRKLKSPVQAVVSSLAIHHLDGPAKQLLFKDVYAMLELSGAFIVADMVEPASRAGCIVAADAWDEVVRQRSIKRGGDNAALEFFLNEHWNTYRYPDPDDIDHPSPLFDQMKWMELAGFVDIDVHFFLAGHALFSGWKRAHRP